MRLFCFMDLLKKKIRNTWYRMKSRCYNEKNTRYQDYGGRNIQVCDEWRNNFEAFYEWCINNGCKEGLSIDRKENNHGYHPLNCRWVTMNVQAGNKRNNVYVSHNGEVKTVYEACRELGINPTIVYHRIKIGMSSEDALSKPFELRQRKKDFINKCLFQ